jgi:hypothetical protein
MKWFGRKKTIDRQLTRRDALNGIPLKNPRVQENRGDNGDLLLVYPLAVQPWVAALAKYIKRRQPEAFPKKLLLDRLGAATWQLVDGHSTVRHIVTRFAETYQLDRREAEIAVTQFLRELGKRGLIAIQ